MFLIIFFRDLVGNIFVYFAFRDKQYIDRSSRRTALYCLVAICAVAVIEFAFLPKSISKNNTKHTYGPIKTLKTMWNLLVLKRMMWLCVYFAYGGN